MMPPDKRKPVADEATGFQKIELLASKIEKLEDSPNATQLQARHLENTFGLPRHIAAAIALLAFGEARP